MANRYFNIYGYNSLVSLDGDFHYPYLCTVKAENYEETEKYAMTLPEFYCEIFGRGYIREVKIIDLTEEEQ